MNAADQRKLTPWLTGLCLLLLAIWVALLAGLGTSIRWGPARQARALSSAGVADAASVAPPLTDYVEVWQRPLFTHDRQPRPAAGGGVGSASLDDFVLTGVFLAPGMHVALLTNRKDHATMRIREGAPAEKSSWVLKKLKPRSAEFVNAGRVIRLVLQVHATSGQPAGDQAGAANADDSSSSAHGKEH